MLVVKLVTEVAMLLTIALVLVLPGAMVTVTVLVMGSAVTVVPRTSRQLEQAEEQAAKDKQAEA